jgi:methionyl-tRNA formyltransferase
MKVAFLGCTKYSEEIFLNTIKNSNIEIAAIFSIPQKFRINYSDDLVVNSNFADMELHAKQNNIPFYYINGEKNNRLQDYFAFIETLDLDVILVLGWYYMVPRSIRNLTKFGAWGIHASLLPDYAGGAPLVWSIIEGASKTGVTLFKLEDGVDNGDIILQEEFSIQFEDSIKEVYQKATEASIKILKRALDLGSKNTFTKQDSSKIKIYPQRSPSDGLIDFSKPALSIYNFIRAQSAPYPGAYFITTDKKKIIIEKARISEE